MSDLITQPKLNGVTIEIVAEAVQMKNDALLCSKDVTSVEDGFEATVAASAQSKLRDLIKAIEESRKLAKAPILAMGGGIDGIAKGFIEEVKSEEARIAKMLGAFQLVEREKKQAAEREAKIAEQKVLVEDAEKAIADGNATANVSEDALEKINRLRNEAANKHDAVKGVKVRTTKHYEVVDESLLLEARPDLFSPDASKIKRAIKTTNNIPGLTVWEEHKSY